MPTTATVGCMLACEIWTPDAQRGWNLAESAYGPYESLRPEPIRRRVDGLPVTCAAAGEALIATDTTPESRIRDPQAPRIDAALLLPFYDGERLVAVVQMLLEHSASLACEWWRGQAGDHELALAGAWHPGLERFATVSKHVRFPHDSGLPGRAWARASAQLCPDLSAAPTFLRSSSASTDGLVRALALPILGRQRLLGVAMLLSGARAPLYRGAEVWVPHRDGRLHRLTADMPSDSRLAAAGARHAPAPGEGLIGRAWAARRPVLADQLAEEAVGRGQEAHAEGYLASLAIPIIHNGDCRCIAQLWW